MEELRRSLESSDQAHVLKFYDDLSDEEKGQLRNSIEDVDWQFIRKLYLEEIQPKAKLNFKSQSKLDDNLIEPLSADCVSGTLTCTPQTLNSYKDIGLSSIKERKVAALLLAGGQGTRLGVDYPKGMYDVGTSVNKSLFQLQAERILKLSETTGQSCPIFWYIMTSNTTMVRTKTYFESNHYFGLPASSVIFFEQNTVPCLGFDGKVLMDEKFKIARSPNGNGGLFEAIHQRGILEHMRENGVQYLHVYCVDNILVRVCDPTFIGYCLSTDTEAASKVVEKEIPTEAVGVICKVGGKIRVIEYSEVSYDIATRRDKTNGKLVFNAGNICDQFFKVDFLSKVGSAGRMPYHLAIKKIPNISLNSGEKEFPDEPNGIKLEKFIFDVLEFADKFVAWQVCREDEFSPIKNANGSDRDTPDTACKALLRAYEKGLLTV